jgi:hypothetical protein
MKNTNNKTNPIIAREIKIEVCRKNKQLLQNKIEAVLEIPQKIKALVSKQQKIEAAYRVLKINHLLQFDSAYIDTKARLQEFKKIHLQEELELLQKELMKEQQRQESLKQTLFQKLELQKQQLMRQQIERAVCEKNKRKKEQNKWKRSHSHSHSKNRSRNGGSKSSSISSIYSQTHYGSLWPYRK